MVLASITIVRDIGGEEETRGRNDRNLDGSDDIPSSSRGRPESAPSRKMSSFAEETALRTKTTRGIQREHEKSERTKDVQERLGPIVARLKTSLAKMESLEESMDRLGIMDGTKEEGFKLSDTMNSDQLLRSALLRSGKSREVMRGSMELVKKKLLRLKRMEEALTLSEDRRHDLQHQLLQVSLSTPNLEVAAVKRQNIALQRKVDQLTEEHEEIKGMGTDQNQLVTRLQQELDKADKERSSLKEDLFQRQAKINEQAIHSDELECELEQVKQVCEELMTTLKQQEERTVFLEQEVLEARKVATLREHVHPITIHCHPKKGSSTTEMTVSSSTTTESTCRGDDNSFDSSFTNSSASMPLILQHSDRPTMSILNSMEDQKSMIETLMATIEVLDRENAQLREEKHHFIAKCKSQQNEMTRQTELIQEMGLRLENLSKTGTGVSMERKTLPPISGEEEEGRNGTGGPDEISKGSFFQRFLTSASNVDHLVNNKVVKMAKQ